MAAPQQLGLCGFLHTPLTVALLGGHASSSQLPRAAWPCWALVHSSRQGGLCVDCFSLTLWENGGRPLPPALH